MGPRAADDQCKYGKYQFRDFNKSPACPGSADREVSESVCFQGFRFYSLIALLTHSGLLFHSTPIRYTGIPLRTMTRPIPQSTGAEYSDRPTMKAAQKMKTIGHSIGTCIERER